MSTTVIHSINWIVSNPDIRSGRPCIAGTGLRVIDVVMASLFHQQTPDEIAVNYAVPLAGVHAAFSYYYEHKAELDTDIRQQLELADKLKEQHIANGGRSLN